MEEKNKIGFYRFGRFESSQEDYREIMDKQKWISFGKKNDFPQELIRIYQTSTGIHQALCDTKAQMIAGNGWNKDAIEESLKLKIFYKNRYSKDNLDNIVKKCAYDMAISNSCYLNIVWDETGTKIAKIEHIPFERVRVEKPTEDTDTLNWYISRDWEKYRKIENKPVLYPGFDPKLAQAESEDGWNKSQILPIFVYSPGMDFYTLPAYHATLDSIKAMYEASLFELKSIQNGFNAGMIIVNKGEYTADEQEELYQDIKGRYSSADNAGDFIMMFVPDQESVPEITPIELQNTAERFINFKETITEAIIQGHGATSQVAGKETAGKLGSSKEIKEAYELFQKKTISPYQELLEGAFNKLAEINGVEDKLELNTYNLADDSDISPVDYEKEAEARASLRASKDVITTVMELRAAITAGTLDYNAAKEMLELVYGYNEEEVEKLLGANNKIEE